MMKRRIGTNDNQLIIRPMGISLINAAVGAVCRQTLLLCTEVFPYCYSIMEWEDEQCNFSFINNK